MYYIVTDKKFLSFEWGRAQLAALKNCAKKNNIVLKEFDYTNPPNDGVLFALGVDSLWLDEIAGIIENYDITVIQMCGKTNNFKNRVINISTDQPSAVYKCIELLNKNNRTKPAFFGVQKNDTSDMTKKEEFIKYFSPADVYSVDDEIKNTFENFYKYITKYDSVICANDIIAVYLLKQLKNRGINVPNDLYVTGNGNLWIGSHIKPTLTTVSNLECDTNNIAEMCFQLVKKQNLCNSFKSILLNIDAEIICRESTGNNIFDIAEHKYTVLKQSTDTQIFDSDIKKINNINIAFTTLSQTALRVLKGILANSTYDEIAQSVFITGDAVKYHIKKLYTIFGVHSRGELLDLLNDNLIDINKL